MYAIIRTGGKQYRVEAGQSLRVAKMNQKTGTELSLSEVLYVKGHVGTPYVSGAKVMAVVKREAKDKKILVFKKKRRKGYRKIQGHRQDFTELFIKSIQMPDGKKETASTSEKKVSKKTKKVTQSATKKKSASSPKSQGVKKKTRKVTSKKTSAKKVSAKKKK